MATDSETRGEFFEKAKPVRAVIKTLLEKEKAEVSALKKESEGTEHRRLQLADQMIYLATLYMAINTLSVEVLNFKNNDALNDARKAIYRALIYMEEVVSNVVDCPYTDIEPRLEPLADMSIEKRFYLVRKLGLAINLLTDAFGDNSKWKWSFVEIRGRFIVVAKNLLDMKKAAKDYFDPNSSDYENTILYVRLLRKLLDQCATEYRDKYELGSRRRDDMQMGINLLIAARRVAMILSDSESAEEIKRKALAWRNRLDADIKTGSGK